LPDKDDIFPDDILAAPHMHGNCNGRIAQGQMRRNLENRRTATTQGEAAFLQERQVAGGGRLPEAEAGYVKRQTIRSEHVQLKPWHLAENRCPAEFAEANGKRLAGKGSHEGCQGKPTSPLNHCSAPRKHEI
jgi:hypothetical protein